MGKLIKDGQTQEDKDLLEALGYKQELKRNVGLFSNFALSFSIISILSGLIILYDYGLANAGPAAIWTWPLVAFFQLLVALSFGEIATVYPLAGAIYQWSSRLGNRTVGWFNGWIVLVGWWACTVGIAFGFATFSIPYFGIPNTILNQVIVTVVTLTLYTIINIAGIKLVSLLQNLNVIAHIIGVFVLVAVLFIFGVKQPVSFLFNTNGHHGTTFWGGFVLAILMSTWTLTGFDSSADLAEETHDPRRGVPRGMIIAVLSSFVLGMLLLIGLTLSISNLHTVMGAPPAAMYIITHSLGGFANIINWIIIIAQFLCGLGSMTAFIRVVYALSRDGNLPFSRTWSVVHARLGTPVPASILTWVSCLVLTIGVAALPIITSLASLGFSLSYGITIACALYARAQGRLQKGPFNLGRFGTPIAIVAMVWCFFASVIMVFPPNQEAGLIFIGVVAILFIYYFAAARKRLENPSKLGSPIKEGISIELEDSL